MNITFHKNVKLSITDNAIQIPDELLSREIQDFIASKDIRTKNYSLLSTYYYIFIYTTNGRVDIEVLN